MFTIQEMIDKTLAEKDKNHISSHKWKPSKFGYCFRNQYWSRKGEPESNPSDFRSMRVMFAGKLFHDFVQNLLGGEKEVKVESEDIKGFADLVRDNEVIDIKSQHSKAFWYMSKFKGDDIKKEKYPNWLQVMYYARELKKNFGRLVFVSKDDLCINEYVQPLDDYWLKQLNTELCALRYLWKKQELPSALPRCFISKDGKSKECQYCNFLGTCNELEGFVETTGESEDKNE